MNAISLTLVIVSVSALLWATGHWLARRPIFIFHSVQINNIHRADAAHVAVVVRRELKGTFFTMDFESVQHALRQVPWVRMAGLHRQWPDKLIVTIEEYEPFAFWNESALVSRAGEVFVAPYDGDLPQLSGIDAEALTVVEGFERWSVLLAPLRIDLRAVHHSPRNSWHIEITGDYGTQWVELGKEDMDERITRFATVYRRTMGALARSGIVTDYIDLRYRNGLTVRVHENTQSLSRS
jgi:cell division protein FtsQ